LLGDAALRSEMGDAARRFVQSQQGATEHTLALLDRLIAPAAEKAYAA